MADDMKSDETLIDRPDLVNLYDGITSSDGAAAHGESGGHARALPLVRTATARFA